MRAPLCVASASSKADRYSQARKAYLHISRSRHWNSKVTESQAARNAVATKMEQDPNYKDWSHDSLVERVFQLERELKERNQRFSKKEQKVWKKFTAQREFEPSKYSTRLIALKLAYLGKNYNGFEHHANNITPRPTIEEELWKALYKCRLIHPTNTGSLRTGEVNWEGCEYSKCGRTDKGVSAFGQVIGIRVRSNRPLRKQEGLSTVSGDEISPSGKEHPLAESELEPNSLPLSNSEDLGEFEGLSIMQEDYKDDLSFDPIKDEIPYATILNHQLPPDIRILAWCPAPPLGFSARFSCKERQYKYFFTQPAFPPTPAHLEHGSTSVAGSVMKDGWLDIEAMREAVKSFVGVHDFRNFCKVDASKQISNFMRRIFHADIVEEDATNTLDFVNGASFLPKDYLEINGLSGKAPFPKVYSFTLHGSAFLWHQVRHMVAILFLVGQGLESPSLVSELLDVEKNSCRPSYEMASGTPLVLWDCIFPDEDDKERKDVMRWLHVGDKPGRADAKYGPRGLMTDLWQLWRERKIDEVLAGSLLDVVTALGAAVDSSTSSMKRSKSQMVFDGNDVARPQGIYIPVTKKPRLESVESINQKYAVRKGLDSPEEVKELGYRKSKMPAVMLDNNDE